MKSNIKMEQGENTLFSEIVEDSIEVSSEIIEDSGNTKDDRESLLSKVVQDSFDAEDEEEEKKDFIDITSPSEKKTPQEVVKDSIDAQEDEEDKEDSIDITSPSEERKPLGIDLNILAGCGFDLNKFPEDEDDTSSDEKELKKEKRSLLKIFLPEFY